MAGTRPGAVQSPGERSTNVHYQPDRAGGLRPNRDPVVVTIGTAGANAPAVAIYSGIMRKPQMSEDAARELETDDDPERFKERLGKIARAKPKPEKPE